MKNMSKKITLPVVLLASVPMLILGGCAGNDTKSFTGDMSLADTQLSAGLTEDEMVREQLKNLPVEMAVQGEGDYQSPQELVEIDQSVEAVESIDNVAPVVDAERTLLIEPQEKIIGFGFDQADIDGQYTDLLIQHADYIKENKSLVLNISGHTDSTGDRTYNELLSKKRANAVASILIELGVPEDQIKVTGYASDEPLMGAVSHREHRRVELNYQDQQFVSN